MNILIYYKKVIFNKSSKVNVKQTLVRVIPFTNDKLHIYEGKIYRVNKYLYDLFLIIKMKILVDEKKTQINKK